MADFYSRPFTDTQPVLEAIQAGEQELEQLLERWVELEEQQQRYEQARAEVQARKSD